MNNKLFKSLALISMTSINISCAHDAVCNSKLSKGTQIMLKNKSNKNSKLFGSKSKMLKNGLQVIVVEDNAVPRVSIGVLYKVGSCDDTESLMGISHMTEHMFFHGSKRYPNVSKTIGDLGGDTNAFTSEDSTMYIADCPVSGLETILDLEADRMKNFYLPNDVAFKKEQKAVYEERLMRVENIPLGTTFEYIKNSLSPQHPHGKDIGGMRHHIMDYSRDAVMDHYHKWYKPNNAVLVVIGAVKAEDVFNLAEKYFGDIKPGKLPKRERVQNAISKDIYHEIHNYSDKVETEKVSILYNVPNARIDGKEKCYALSIALNILFGGVVYEFPRYFIDKKHLVSDIDYSYEWDLFDHSPLNIAFSLSKNISYEKLSKKFFSKLKDIVKNGIKKEEFERAKNGYITNLAYVSTDGHKRIRMNFALLSAGLTLDDIESTKDDIESISIDQVNAVIKEVFDTRPFGIIRISPLRKE